MVEADMVETGIVETDIDVFAREQEVEPVAGPRLMPMIAVLLLSVTLIAVVVSVLVAGFVNALDARVIQSFLDYFSPWRSWPTS
jgi:hypothetical protein